jgi:hypothetical protein
MRIARVAHDVPTLPRALLARQWELMREGTDGLHRRLAPRRRDPTGDDEVVDLDAVCGKDRCQHRKNPPGKERKTQRFIDRRQVFDSPP